jgi:hypothetical protein
MSAIQIAKAKRTIENTFLIDEHFDFFLTKPRADVIILGVEKDLTNHDKKIINKKISFRSNLVDLHAFDTFTRIEDDARAIQIEETYGLKELAIIGVSIDEASVYGKKAKVAFSDQRNFLWNTIESGDIIVINTYLDGQKNIDVEDFILDDRINLNSYFEELILGDSKVDFCGIVTTKQKDIKSTDQVRIEATDFTRIMQQINVPIGKYYDKIDKKDTTKYCMEAVSSRFIEAFLNKISKIDVNDFFNIMNPGIDYEDLTNNYFGFENFRTKTPNFRDAMDNIFVTKTYQNETGDKVIYSIFANTLKIAEYLLEYELEKIGLLNYMDVDTFIPKQFEKYYAKVFGKDMFPKNLVVLNLYFGASADDELQISDIMTDKGLNLKDLKNSLMFYTLDKVYDFSFVNLHIKEKADQDDNEEEDDGVNDEMSDFISNNLYFLKDNFVAMDDAQRVHEYMIEFKTELENDTLSTFKMMAFQQNKETINSINFNKFFFYLDYNKISIRSTKFKGEGDFKNTLPVTQIMMYALSLFVYRPKYFNPFSEFDIPDIVIPFYKSGKLMYSLSKMVWFESTIKKAPLFSERPIQVIFFPVMTPMIVDSLNSIDKYNKEDENVSTMVNKSDFLEMQFNRYDVNDNILQIKTDYSTEYYDYNPFMIFAEKDGDAGEIMPKKISMFGDNTVDLQDSEINYKISRHIKDYTDFVSDLYNKPKDFFNNWSSRYPAIWYDSGDGLSFYQGKDVTTGDGNMFYVHDEDGDKIGNNTEINSYVNVESLMTNFENEIEDGKTKDVIGITQLDGDDQLAIVIPAFEIEKGEVKADNLALFRKTKILNRNAYKNMDPRKYKSRYQVKYYLKRTPIDAKGKTKVFGGYTKQTLNFNIAGVQSTYNLQALRDAIKEEFTYSRGLPKEITDSIFLNWRKFDVKFDFDEGEEGFSVENLINEIFEKVENLIQGDETVEREDRTSLLNLSDIEEYMNDIIDFIEQLTRGGIDIYPSQYTLYPDIQSILDYVVGNDGLKLTGRNNQNKKEYMIALMKDLFTIIKNPVTVDVTGKVKLPSAYRNLEKITFDGDMFVENKSKENMELVIVTKLIEEIFTLSYLVDVFVQDILRKNNYSGSFFMANRGTRKVRVGQYLHINNDVRDGALESIDILGDITSLVTNVAVNVAAKSHALLSGAKKVYDIVENILRDVDKSDESITEAIYTTTVDYTDKTKPFGWFVWKTATYLGNASGDAAGTSGYNQKVYLARDGVNYGSNFEEEDFLTSFIQDLQNTGFSVEQPNY